MFFYVARTAKQAILDVSSMEPDAVHMKNKPVEARSSFQTEPSVLLATPQARNSLVAELQLYLDIQRACWH